jgi:cytoskeleton protein RodZ
MASLGQQLKQSREEKGISLQEIAESTHISVRFLQAIENDAYDVLPGGVFNRAFVRKFARQVGFDEEQAVNLYQEQWQEQGGEPDRGYQLGVEEFESRETSGNGLLLSFVALIVLGSLAYLAVQYFTPAVSNSGGSNVAGLNTPTPSNPETPTPGVTPGARVSPSLSPTPGATASPSLSPTPGATASPSPSPTPEAPASAMRFQFTAPIEEVWIKVMADGKDAKQMVLKPGESWQFDVNEEIILSIGRVRSLRIAVNGGELDSAKFLSSPKAIRVSNVVINKDNLQQYLKIPN